jgi:thioredoxin 1
MSNFTILINAEKPVLVDFFAEWCGPCKMMKPILEEVKKSISDKVNILKVDVDKNKHAAMQYQIQGVPTLILFKKGKILWRQSGVVDAKSLKNILNQYA